MNPNDYPPRATKSLEELQAEINAPLSYSVGYKRPPTHTRFAPGNPGGPGRPKHGPLYRALKKALLARGAKLADDIVQGIIDRALKGSPSDVRILLLITDGKRL
jgi:hypothetical protein